MLLYPLNNLIEFITGYINFKLNLLLLLFEPIFYYLNLSPYLLYLFIYLRSHSFIYSKNSIPDFRGKVLGPTDPKDSPEGALRGTILKVYKLK